MKIRFLEKLTEKQTIFLYSFLIALGLTLLTAFSVTSTVRRAAQTALLTLSDEALIETLRPLQYLRFRISILPTAIGSLIVALPVWRIYVDKRTSMRAIWVLVILVLLSIIWLICLLTLSVSPVSLFKMVFLLLRTLSGAV